ncbi:MAG: tRNA preQ1(34) S-adenosylmethionine ribosyltransferase-isomerase QueA [Pseudomonadota bacterium]
MKRSDFNFQLPEELIAQFPNKERTASRLLTVDGKHGSFTDSFFKQIGDFLQPGDLLILNNTQVIPARLYGQKKTGGKIEVLMERVLSNDTAMVKIRSSKSPKIGSLLNLGTDQNRSGFAVEVIGRDDDLFKIQLSHVSNNKGNNQTIYQLLDTYGHVPLPPYVKRDDTALDLDRYQTVYASEKGAVAAPTAGLHFDQALIDELQAKGINFANITLHVGAGTYQPVRADNILDHKMHSETIFISNETAQRINQTKQAGHRIIAVGTTSLRSLESSATFKPAKKFLAYQGDSDIFIYPGYQFKVVDALITNFHLPESTLFMLVSAFCGLKTMQDAYQHAIDNKYRFFSYGDAMFLTPKTTSNSPES